NALGASPEEQLQRSKNTAQALLPLIEEGNQIIITHGNGPQVGMINLAFENSKQKMPFPESGAMSQGYIGFHLQNALQNEIKKAKLNKTVTTIITQVEVDPNDEAFLNPTKPIGAFYSYEEALEIEKANGYPLKEDSGRGYRRVVASPKPLSILEINSIEVLVNAGQIVIACGGGGIPVIDVGNNYQGIAAVIDKDYASSLLAQLLKVDYFFILTAVDQVAINFGKPNQLNLDILKVEDAKEYIEAGHFKKGSMLPKVEAALSFLQANPKGVAVIASLEKVASALKGEAGTKIII
ncbi:MAG: carbamate kinase, partial [Bacilli bacterium]|nr:carbamate kinase [Bacilli bacterium]